mgnify:CR=1 FL=1
MKGLITIFCLIFFYAASAQKARILSLQECVDIAIENNLSVKRSQLNLESNRINLLQAQGARLPDANVGGSYGLNFGRSINPTTNEFINQEIEFSGFNGSTNVTLFRGLSLTNSVRQSKAQVESSEFDLEKAKNDISLNIINFYLNVIFNKELVENARYQLQSSEEQLERTKKLVEIGSLPRTNELELISQVASNEVNLVNAENNLDVALLNLKQAMLIPGSEQIDIIIPDIDIEGDELPADNEEEVFEMALDSQPEIKSAESNLEAARYGVKSAQGNVSPTVSGRAGFSTNYSDAFFRTIQSGTTTQEQTVIFQGQEAQIEFEQPNFIREDVSFNDQLEQNLSKSVSLNLSIPLFNGFNTHAQIQRAKISLQQAEINRIETRNTLRQQIETAFNDARSALKTFEASQKQVDALEETFRAVENQYNFGAANFTDYQVASNNLFGARSDLVRAKYDLIFKLKLLDFYMGNPLNFQ